MKARDRPHFDVDMLRDMAGERAFERGEAYCRDGQVRILSFEPGRVLALVTGSEDYRTELTGRGKRIGGACSCPAFEDRGFCKHMVAVGLAANASDGSADGAGALARMREHLKGKGIDALVELIVGLAERDPALFRRLDMAAAVVRADDKMLEARQRQAIDGATRTRGFVDYREAAGWAAGVDAALDTLAALMPAGRAGLALRLVERAIDRIESAIEEIDDSDGHCGTLLERAQDIHLAAAGEARPEPVQLARDLFAREVEGQYDTFSGVASLYAGVLGDAGLAEYRRLAAEAWEKLPWRSGGAGRPGQPPDGYYRLKDILDVFAERDGDVDARVALRARDLSSPWRYLELAEFCLSQGREDEALRRAEEGLWVFEDGPPDERLVFFVAGLLSKAGRDGEAEACVWRAFEKAPGLELFTRFGTLGGSAARKRAIKFLEAGLGRTDSADLLIRVLTQQGMFDAAWTAVQRYGASRGVREGLARASEATHPREAVETYAERVDQLARSGGNSAYADAARLIARMATLRNAAEHAGYVAELKSRFSRKRNFIKVLD